MDIIEKFIDEDEYESVSKFLQDLFVINTARTIKFGSIVAINADNRHYNGYYMVEFTSSPYTIQQNKTIDEKFIKSGELVSNGMYFMLGYPTQDYICNITPRKHQMKFLEYFLPNLPRYLFTLLIFN